MNFGNVLIAAVGNSVFASLRLCFEKYLNMLYNFTLWHIVEQTLGF
jgi:hypothetical protein